MGSQEEIQTALVKTGPPAVNPIPPSIAEQLQRLRRRLTLWVVVDGLSRLLMGLIAFLAIDLWLDWSFQMDRPQRIVMLMLAAAGLLSAVYRRLWKPLAVPPTDDALILEVEEKHPELQEGLISAIQFARQPAPAGVSESMLRATVAQGAEAARRLPFFGVLQNSRFVRSALLLVAAVLILGGTAAAGFVSDTVSIWFNRNVLLGDREWPQDVHFQITGEADGILIVPAGDDWPIEIVVTEDSRRRPSEVWLEVRGEARRQRLESIEAGRRYHGQLERVTEPLEFRVAEARAASPWIRVQLVERPAVAELQLTVTAPAYAQAAPEVLAPGGGPYKVLQGSRLSIRGRANKPLSAATIAIGKDRQSMTLLDGHRFQFELTPQATKDADYAIDLLDTEAILLPGEESPQPLASRDPATFRLKLVPDREPQVQAKLAGIGNLVTPKALIPISGRITDDFGVAELRLHWRWRGEKDEADTTGSSELSSSASLPSAASDFQTTLDLEPLSIATGVSLSFFLEATDNNSVSGPGKGRSTVFLVRVVTEEEFRAALLAREREQGVELQKRIKLQDELLTDSRSLAAAIAGRTEILPEERNQLDRLRKRQKSIGDDVARIARAFDGFVAEVRQNRIEDADGPVQTRLTEKIIRPLWDASGSGIDSIIVPLEAAGRDSEKPSTRDRQLADAATAEEQLLARLKEVASQLEQAQGFQEAVNMLLEVQKAQQEVRERTEQEKEQALKALLDGPAEPESTPEDKAKP